jgi:hypothetical protein
MAIAFDSLRTNLATVLNTITGKKIVWSNQNANTPSGDFVLLKITSMRFVGFTDWQGKPDASEKTQTQGDREIVLSIQAISENAMGILLDLLDKLNLNSNIDLLSTNKIAFVNVEGGVNDITTQVGHSFESRAAVDLVFRISKNYSSATEDDTAVVQSIGIGGELDGNVLPDPVELSIVVDSGE